MKTSDIRKVLEKASFGPLNDYGMVISVDSIPYIIRKIKQFEKEYAQQSTKEITDKAIIAKLEEYNAYLKRAIHSESIIDNITAGVRDKFEKELNDLKTK